MFREELDNLLQKNLVRQLVSRSSAQGARVTIGGQRYINFSSNDYLGLSHHPLVVASVKAALDTYGFGSGASRLLAGGTVLHEKLEAEIADFKGTEDARVFNSGYAANIGMIPAIAREGDVIYSDELNHASIIDGCRLSRAKTVIFRHGDITMLEELVRKEQGQRKVIITDSIFSMDGDLAPLGDIYQICREHGVLLYLDDAHGTGVLGDGRGARDHFNLPSEPWVIQMGTFSKALGSYGAFVAGSRETIHWISQTARSLIFSTALPPCVISGSLTALNLLRKGDCLIQELWSNRKQLAEGLSRLGYDIKKSASPIIPIMTDTIQDATKIAAELFKQGIYVPAIRPPTVNTPRLRLTVTSEHDPDDLALLISRLGSLQE